MAELVSIRNSADKDENIRDKTKTQVAVENPAYSNDIEAAKSNSDTNGDVANTSDKASALLGTTITFHDLIYTVDIKVKRKKVKKEIVKGIRYVVANVNNVCKALVYEIYNICTLRFKYIFIAIILTG